MTTPTHQSTELNEDLRLLHSMGYAQELARSINSLAQATSGAGGVARRGAAIGIGWPLGCLISPVT